MDFSPKTGERLARGRELFNAGRYFEAHEAWENAWREETGLVKLRGLPEGACGLALGEFRRAVEEALAQARLWQAGERAGLDPQSSVRLSSS